MALENRNDYHSSVLSFLERSAAGNVPNVLTRGRVERLTSLATTFFKACLQELAKDSATNSQQIDRASEYFTNAVRSINEANRDSLVTALTNITKGVQVAIDSDILRDSFVRATVTDLVIELLDTAEALREESVTVAVTTLCTVFDGGLHAAGVAANTDKF